MTPNLSETATKLVARFSPKKGANGNLIQVPYRQKTVVTSKAQIDAQGRHTI